MPLVLTIINPIFSQILALKASGAGTEMDTLANATSGVVKLTSSDSSDIVTEILQVR